jgi:hypothetical protein
MLNFGFRRRAALRPLTLLGAAACVAGVASATAAFETEAAAPPAPAAATSSLAAEAPAVAELERQFWLCDHASTRSMLGFAEAVPCSRVTEELRRQRFGNDFHAMLAWWRERKATEHAALDAAAAAAAPRVPAASPAPAAPARSAPNALAAKPLDGATADELKAAYLHCDRLARTEEFDGAAAAACSVVYEALKARVFGGDTERVIAWMQQQRAAAGDARRSGGR